MKPTIMTQLKGLTMKLFEITWVSNACPIPMTELVEGATKMEARGHIVRREVNRGTPKFLEVLQMSEADADQKGYQLYPVAG